MRYRLYIYIDLLDRRKVLIVEVVRHQMIMVAFVHVSEGA